MKITERFLDWLYPCWEVKLVLITAFGGTAFVMLVVWLVELFA